MIDMLLTILRNKDSSIEEFRMASEQMATLLAHRVYDALEKEEVEIETPLGKTSGKRVKRRIVLIPILRAGLILLPSFLKVFPQARVGMIGLKRDEHTAIAAHYYDNVPTIHDDDEVLILDPMLATGGSSQHAIALLVKKGVRPTQILQASVISAPEGVQELKRSFPEVRTVIVQQDEKLTPNKFIYPGLGDFGDRFYGTY